jgi:NTP pyrophosphatase (non-canonical NTP hydrolase)
MEKFELSLQSQPDIDAYVADHHLMPYEKAILLEIAEAIASGDAAKLNWFGGFGDSFRAITMNLNEHRRALEFGFTEIVFTKYGWFASPKFLDREEIKLEQSEVRIGHGPNGIWAYGLSCNYGTAGSSGPLCVFCKKYPNRDAALNAALEDMKAQMTKYLGNSDTTNYKQDILQKTLEAIGKLEVSMVQLTLF